MLAAKHPHHKDTRVRFEAEGHRYYVDGCAHGYVSVTTWLSAFTEKFDAEAVLAQHYNRWQNDPQNKYYGMSRDDVKHMWSSKGERACTLGTALHECIEAVFNEEVPKMPAELAPEWEAFERFRAGRSMAGLVPFRTEMIVFDDSAKLAGSVDFLARVGEDGPLVIFDWKRSTQSLRADCPAYDRKTLKAPFGDLPDTVFYKYSLQLNVYRVLLEDVYGFEVQEANLVQMHADKTDEEGKVVLNVVRVPDLREAVRVALKSRRELVRSN